MKQAHPASTGAALFQGLEKQRRIFPGLGKAWASFFQFLEKPRAGFSNPWKGVWPLLLLGAAQGALDYDFATLAGQMGTNGSANGTGSAAQFDQPGGLVIASNGTLYVADSANHTIRAIAPGGVVTTLAGSAGLSGTNDGVGAAARFSFPQGLALDSNGHLVVADTGNSTIRRVTPEGVVTTFAGSGGRSGTNDGVGAAARFLHPYGVTVDGAGQLFVTDTGNDTIRKITPLGEVTTFAGQAGSSGSTDGTGHLASFFSPTGIVVDRSNVVFVADTDNSKIRRLDAAGNVSTFAGATEPGHLDGTGTAASFSQPYGLALDAVGNLYVADKGNGALRRISPTAEVTTSANSTNLVGGLAPQAVAVDTGGNVLLADTGRQVVRSGELTGGGLILVQAGTGGGEVSGSGLFLNASNVQLSATASHGWAFLNWNDGDTNSTRTITVAGSATYTATFGQWGLVTVLVVPTNAGSASGGGSYALGSHALLTAIASNGWQFASWNETITSNPWPFAVSQATTCTAYFIPARTEYVFQDDFEQGLGNWSVSGSGARWGLQPWPFGGTSVWCAADSGDGCAPWGAAYRYANSMDTRLERSFDLRGYTTATLRFDYKLLTESAHDFLKVYINGDEVFSQSGYANWSATGAGAERAGFHRELDLSAYCGQAGVTVRFAFESDATLDGSNLSLGMDAGAVGALLDNMLIFGSRHPTGQKVLGVPVKGKLHLLCCGQSNMAGASDGYGTLPAYMQADGSGASNCYFHNFWESPGLTNSYGPLRAFNASYWGPELTMGDQLARQLHIPVFISKWASGGSDLANMWRKGVHGFYTNIVPTATGTSNVWPTAGSVDAFIWVQGESDTAAFTSAYAYEAHLRQFIADVRADLGQLHLPFLILGLSEKFQTNTLGNAVWQAQQRVAATDPDVFFIAADGAPRQPAPWDSHYTSAGYQEIGQRLASNLVSAARVISPAIASSVTNDAHAISSAGVTCWLPCESTNLMDISSSAHYLTNYNLYAQSIWTNAQGWLRLGDQGALQIGTNLAFNSSSLSVSLWVYSTTPDHAPFALGAWFGAEWPLSLATILHTSNVQDGRPQAALRSYGNYVSDASVQGLLTMYVENRITTGCWHHIGVVLDRAGGTLTTFLNGIPAAQQTGNFASSSNLIQSLWLGTLCGGGNRTVGFMRHPMLWPRALSREELWGLYQLQLRGQRGAQVYQLSVQANPAHGGVVQGGGLFTLDAAPQITASASNGWGFLGWSDGGTQTTRVLTPVDGSAAYTANFGLLATLVVVANTNAGGSVTGSGTFFVGSNATLIATASNGWCFLGWQDGVTNASRTIVVASNMNYTATFAPVTTVTTVDLPPEGGRSSGGGIYVVGSNVTLTATASNGWLFTSWNGAFTNNPWTFSAPEGGSLCTANFARISIVSVWASPTNGGDVTGGGVYFSGSPATLTATASNNWLFTGWGGGVTNNPLTIVAPETNLSYTAYFAETANITAGVNTNAGGSVTGSGTFFVGSNATLTATASNGWLFLRWSDGNTSNPRTVAVGSGGATYTAVFAPTAVLVVQADPVSGGSVTGGGTFVVGSTNWIAATASNAWWRFLAWQDGNTNAARSIIMPAGGATYLASFAALGTVALYASPTNGGNIAGAGTYIVGSNATLTATASNGWVFLHWNGSVTNNPWLLSVTSGATVCTAAFARVSVVTVLATPTHGGSVTGGGTYFAGSNATLTATPAGNWGFGGWNDGHTSTVRSITVPVTNSTYTATFLAPATVTAGVTPPAGGSVSGAGTYAPGTNITLLATPNTGWGFLNWTDGDSSNPRVVTVPAGGAGYTARFASVAGLGTALEAPQLTWGLGGSAAWAGQTTTTHGTPSAAQSGVLNAGQQSWIQTTTNGPLSLLFWWKVSAAANNSLQFYVNTQLVSQISGNVDWQQYVTFLGTTNSYTLKWVYSKTSATVTGSDAGFVDQVTVLTCPYATNVPQLFFQEPAGMIASWVVETNGAFRFARVLANTGGWALKSAGDIDGDGVSDLLFQNTASATGGWFLNSDGSVRDARFWFNIGGWEIKAAGDYEGLGRAQVFFQTGAGEAAYWRLDPTGAFVAAVSLGNQRPWVLRGAGDLDGDLKAELFWQNSAGVVAIWWHNPDGSIRATIPFATGEWALRGVADVDHDGVCDLLWQTPDTRTGGWFMQTNGAARDARFWWPTGGWQLKAAGR